MSLAERACEVARMPGLRWQERIAMITREFGIPVNESAKALDPCYVSTREASDLITENYAGIIDPNIRLFLEQVAAANVDLSTKIKHVASELRVTEKVAAELLYPYRHK